MQLVVDEYGTFIGKEGNRFKILQKEKKEEFSADQVSQIVVLKTSSLSTGAIKLAIEAGVDIVFLNKFGMPYARVYPCRLGGTTLTRRRQAEEANTEKATLLVKSIVAAKMTNQMYLLKSLQKTRQNADFRAEIEFIGEALSSLENVSGKISEVRGEIMGLEGFASSQYFAALAKILPFSERQHDAKDPFNAMLNYGYGILYSEVEKVCILAGLDPYLGFLHTDRYGKPSMVLDLIEQFRQPVVDKAIITLFATKQVKDADAEVSGNVLLLTKEGKRKVVEAVLSRLHKEIKYAGRNTTLQMVMLEKARAVAKFILKDHYIYKPFVYRV